MNHTRDVQAQQDGIRELFEEIQTPAIGSESVRTSCVVVVVVVVVASSVFDTNKYLE